MAMDDFDKLEAKILDLDLDIRRTKNYLESLEKKRERLLVELDVVGRDLDEDNRWREPDNHY